VTQKYQKQQKLQRFEELHTRVFRMGAKKRFIIIKDLIQAPHLLATKTAATTTVSISSTQMCVEKLHKLHSSSENQKPKHKNLKTKKIQRITKLKELRNGWKKKKKKKGKENLPPK
jgi:hypothetical protein